MNVFAQDFNKIDRQLGKEFEVLSRYTPFEFEKTEAQNKKIIKLIFQILKKYPKSIQYMFKQLAFVKISTSENKKIRIFSWDNMLSGTGRENINIFQFVDNNQNCVGQLDQYGSIDKIYSISFGSKNVFLMISQQKLSNPIRGLFASALQINSNCTFTEKCKIFKTPKKTYNQIDVNYSIFENDNNAYINFTNNILYIPLVLENGKLTNKFLKYKLKEGSFYFEK